jgi:hypothetical protein
LCFLKEIKMKISKKEKLMCCSVILFVLGGCFLLKGDTRNVKQKYQRAPYYASGKKGRSFHANSISSRKTGSPETLSITKVGEWGTGYYETVFVKGNYAYCAANGAGLDIIDISDPKNPIKVGNQDTPGLALGVHVTGNYALVADTERLEVINVSDPANPFRVGYLYTNYAPQGVFVKGDFAYVADALSGLYIVSLAHLPYLTEAGDCDTSGYAREVYVDEDYAYVADDMGGLQVIDVSDPYSPTLVGNCPSSDFAMGVYVKGNYAYVASYFGGLDIIDISNPSNPFLTGNYTGKVIDASYDVWVKDNYAYVGNGNGLEILDVSNPSNPTSIGFGSTPGLGLGVHISGNHAYISNDSGGLRIFDVSNAANPSETGYFDNSCFLQGMDISGNYAYLADYWYGMQIFDISNPSSPNPVASYASSIGVRDVCVNNNYAYLTDANGLNILNISNPSSPFLAGKYKKYFASEIEVKGNYAYVIFIDQLNIIDISNPSAPSLKGSYNGLTNGQGLFVQGNYAYVADSQAGFFILDISNPSNPTLVSHCYSGYTIDVHVDGQYAYVVVWKGLRIYDVSNPANPDLKGTYVTSGFTSSVCADNNYAFLSDDSNGLMVLDISDPSNPSLLGNYVTPGDVVDLFIRSPYVYATDGSSGEFFVFSISQSQDPQLSLSRESLSFGSDLQGSATPSQSFLINNTGEGTLDWTLSADQSWIQCSPVSGGNSTIVTVSIDAAGLSPGTYTGTITVSDPNATNSPQTVSVELNIYGFGQTSLPFGVFATPVDGSTVSSSIPVTGWVLDDIGAASVKIYRGNPGSLVYIGDAVFVEGARPDIEQAYPGYPMNYKAGWGYMMLTNFLPNGGNGTYHIYAIATDIESHEVTLGSKTIHCDNANAVKPFGAIDTPTQGGTASGSSFVNWGWVLTPPPNRIPTDGSTINVWVDGVNLGHPGYNIYREDIAALFPGYNNSDGAIGYFYLDTIPYEDGVHTIAWTASDDAGNTDGIGSRYFTVQNLAGRTAHSAEKAAMFNVQRSMFDVHPDRTSVDYLHPVKIKEGCNPNVEPVVVYPNDKGIIMIEIKELERVEIHFFDSTVNIEPRTLNLSSLPIGSTLDSKRGIFYWTPGPAFFGDYRLVFVIQGKHGEWTRKDILVKILPKFTP